MPEVLLGCCCSFLNGLCCGTDYVEDAFRLGEHRHMAAVEFVDGGAHALGHSALQIGMNRVVLFTDNVPSGLRFPGGAPGSCLEQVRLRDALRRPNELLLLLRKVSAEKLCALPTQPDTTIHDFYLRKDVCRREIGLLRLPTLVRVWSERTDINQASNPIVGPGAGDDGSAVRVADKDDRAAHSPNRCFC